MKNIRNILTITLLIISFVVTDIVTFSNTAMIVNAANNNNLPYGTGTKRGLRASLHKAMTDLPPKLLKKLKKDEKIIKKDGNVKKTMKSFFDNKYPYDLADVGNGGELIFHTIGNAMYPIAAKSEYGSLKYDEYHARYDDVNWAEIVTIFSMADSVLEKITTEGEELNAKGFAWGVNNYDDFEDFLVSEQCSNYMYEIGLKWIPIYKGKKTIIVDGKEVSQDVEGYGDEYGSPEECANAPEIKYFEGVPCEFKEFYIKSTVKPFGLREEFKIVFPDMDPWDAYNMTHPDFYYHTLGYMLNYSERIDRMLNRTYSKTVSGAKVNALGPSFVEKRSNRSSIYNELLNDEWLKSKHQEGKGRSAWYYIEETYNGEFEKIDWGENKVPDGNDKDPKIIVVDRKKLSEFFPDGIPTTAEEMEKYLTTVTINVIDENGNPTTIKLRLHKAIAEQAKAMIEEMCANGFRVDTRKYDNNGNVSEKGVVGYGGYNFRTIRGGEQLSAHSYGLAFDINTMQNGYYVKGKLSGGGEYDPSDTTSGLTIQTKQVQIAANYGWTWGGSWSSKKDYMHFSVTGG